MKRFMARARGRGAGIMKPFSQITIVVEEKREEKVEPAPKTKSKAAAKRPAKKPAAKKAEKETA
jgi:large subunit ribosomal protein L22